VWWRTYYAYADFASEIHPESQGSGDTITIGASATRTAIVSRIGTASRSAVAARISYPKETNTWKKLAILNAQRPQIR